MNTAVRPTQDIDTIAAVATPPGRGGIGIVRLSGPAAWPMRTQLLLKPVILWLKQPPLWMS